MSVITSSGQLTFNQIHSELHSASAYGYEGGYSLRAMSLHGRWKLNNPVFEMEDRVSDFYGTEFHITVAGRVRFASHSPMSSYGTICNSRNLALYYYMSDQDYFDNYLNGNRVTIFTDNTLQQVAGYQYLYDTARDWLWLVNTYGGLADRVLTDCGPYMAENNYIVRDDCETMSQTWVVQSDCDLIIGRYYCIDKGFNMMYPPDIPCTVKVIDTSSSPSDATVTNCSYVFCGNQTCECSGTDDDNPFIKK